MRTRARAWLVVVLCASVLTALHAGQAPQTVPPTVPTVPGPVDYSRFRRVGDMLLVEPRQPRQPVETAFAITTDPYPYPTLGFDFRPYQTWDFGVVPVAFAPEVLPIDRQLLLESCARWGAVAPVVCVERTTQSQYLEMRKDHNALGQCSSTLGQGYFPQRHVINLPDATCPLDHEVGHALGLQHEHQRPDRDDYITVDFGNIKDEYRDAYEKMPPSPFNAIRGPYDFLSVMHYTSVAPLAGKEPFKPVIVAQPAFAQFTSQLGQLHPSGQDLEQVAAMYSGRLLWGGERIPNQRVSTRFDRADFLNAMERLHALYMSHSGLHRPDGLSIGQRPDFLGIATWIFDVYLGARSAGFTPFGAFDIVTESITQSEEWRSKNPGLTPLPVTPFTPAVHLDRAEFLGVLQQLDAYYASPEGLQRPNGLSIAGGPDFLGIAAWVFDVYLNERLSGASREVAWTRVVRTIEQTDEWRQKHRGAPSR